MKLPILVTALALSVLYVQSASALSYSSTQSVKTVCTDERALLNWSFKNTSTAQLYVSVQDVQTKQRSSERSIASGASASGTLDTDKPNIAAGSVQFTLRESSSGRNVDMKRVAYTAVDCTKAGTATETPAATTPSPAASDLPNTGPREAFIAFTALIIGTGTAWFMTQKELQHSLLNK